MAASDIDIPEHELSAVIVVTVKNGEIPADQMLVSITQPVKRR